MLWNPDGPRWLCFAGWREEGDADDIYADFTARCTNGGETDSSAFLPNDEDRLRLAAENRIAQRAEADYRFKVLVLNTLLQALAERDVGQSVELPSGSTLRVEVVTGEDDPSDDDWISDLFVQVEVNWNEGAGAEDVVRIQDSIPGVTTEEWIADSGIHAGGDPRFYVTVDEVWAERVLAAAEEYGADALGKDPLLVLEPNDGYAHYATQREVDHGYFDGHVLRSLCGRRFVPQHDPGDRPICSECSNTKAAFDLVSGVLRRDPSD